MLLARVFKLVPALLEESEIGVCHRIGTARKQTSAQCEKCTAMFTHHSMCVCLQCQSLQPYSATIQACHCADNSDHCEGTVCTRVTFCI